MTLADEGAKLAPRKLHTLRYSDMPARTPDVPLADGITMNVEHVAGDKPADKPVAGTPDITHNEDGSITVNSVPSKEKAKVTKTNFYDNLAVDMDDTVLEKVGSELLELIEADKSSRKEWEETANRGIDLLGLKIEESNGNLTSGGGNFSRAKDSVLLEAVLRYQSNFNAEMLPSNGPVKVRDDKNQFPGKPNAVPIPQPLWNGSPLGLQPGGPMGGSQMPPQQTITRMELANALERDMNNYLTVRDKVYYPDTDRMSFSQGLFGVAFKKVYRDPVEKRPISRFVMATHLVVNNSASSLHDAKRITHIIPAMTKVEMKRMMMAGAYREIDLSEPFTASESTDAKIAEIEGRKPRDEHSDDRDYTVFECYCYLNLEGYEHKKGLPLPYRVTIEKDSRQILEVRRNWKRGDDTYKPRRRFVKFPLFPGLGFYDYGFVHILGNTTRVLSAIESLMVDGGMLANFPGGVIDKLAARQETNQIRPGPGGFKPIDTGGRPINQVIMPMPYKDVSPNLMQLTQGLKAAAEKLASISELPLGEGRADIPVGTVIAMIEQNTKLLSAVHKRNHSAQAEELEILKELFAEDPEALSRGNDDPARKWEEGDEFSDVKLAPASDPNISSNIMRIMRAQAVVQMAQQAPPGLFDPKKVAMRALKALEIEDPDDLFMPPAPPQLQQPNPQVMDAQAKQAALQQKTQADQQTNQTKLQIQQMEMADHAAERQSQERQEQARLSIQAMKDAREFAAGITPPDSMAPPGTQPFGG